MEAPPVVQPAPPLTSGIGVGVGGAHMSYPDSVDSSPRSRNADSWDEPLPHVPGAKLRLMCSYGGHIFPRPHDKSLCYVGGETRIVVADRSSTLADLSARLSKVLLQGRPFALKYQLPSEDLDSLISVTTDEDLENMIDEYDRTSAHKPSRLRLFLFPTKPESASSIGSILDSSTKSDDWFLNCLNGTNPMSRGFSDSASVNCLLSLEEDAVANNLDSSSAKDLEASQPGVFGNCKAGKQGQDVHSVPDSPMMETSSSFGSTSSSPSLANLPPIRVHVEDGAGGGGVRVHDQKLGIDEQFAQMSVAMQKQDEGFVVLPSPATSGISVPAVAAGDYPNRVFSDDERSEQGMPVGYRKSPAPQPQPQQQQQPLPPQLQPKSGGVGIDLASPDSVSSDNSIGNAISRPKPIIYQEPVIQIPSGTNRVSSNPVEQKINLFDPNSRVHMQQPVHDSGYLLATQFDQQQQPQPQSQPQSQPQPQTQPQPQPQPQYIHAGAHYIHHHPTGPLSVPSFYPVYPAQQQHPHHPHQLDQQYPVYFMPSRPTPAYNLSMQQSNYSEAATGIPSSRSHTPPAPSIVTPSAAYNPTRNAPLQKPEMAAGMYRTGTAAPPLVQVPSAQHQQQYVGYTQIHHPSQSIAPPAATANYAYEFSDPTHAQIFYAQPMATTLPQYQTMTSAPAVVAQEASAQLSTDNMKQQIRTSQPL